MEQKKKKLYCVNGYGEWAWTVTVEADSEEEAERIIIEDTALSEVNIHGGQGMVPVEIVEINNGKTN